jgi:hypothetical protein
VSKALSFNVRRGIVMRITIIKKAASTRKPANNCPWLIEDFPTDKK